MSRDSVEAAVSQFSLECRVGSYYAGPNSIAVPFAPAVTPRWNFNLPFRGIFNATTGKYKEKKISAQILIIKNNWFFLNNFSCSYVIHRVILDMFHSW